MFCAPFGLGLGIGSISFRGRHGGAAMLGVMINGAILLLIAIAMLSSIR